MKTYEAFESNGVEVKLANPVKTIAEARVKTDKLDSRILAHLLRADLIAECYMPSRDVRLSRALLSHRVNITREQTRIKNRIHRLTQPSKASCRTSNQSNNGCKASGTKKARPSFYIDERCCGLVAMAARLQGINHRFSLSSVCVPADRLSISCQLA
jgi:hypothetical protein